MSFNYPLTRQGHLNVKVHCFIMLLKGLAPKMIDKKIKAYKVYIIITNFVCC